MNSHLVVIVALLASSTAGAASKAGKSSGTGKSNGAVGPFLPVGWNPAMRYSRTPPPPNQKAAPKEAWDTPVDQLPDWDQKETSDLAARRR